MKSCVMAGWLMTVSVGNAIVVIFAEARLTDNMVSTGVLFSKGPSVRLHVTCDTKILIIVEFQSC